MRNSNDEIMVIKMKQFLPQIAVCWHEKGATLLLQTLKERHVVTETIVNFAVEECFMGHQKIKG